MRPHLRLARALCLLLAALSLVSTARRALADPPPPFIIALPSSVSGPSGIASDAAGNVYVADTNDQRILKYSSSGTLIVAWGAVGSANGQFNQPWGVAVDAANVYVADAGNNRIQKFTQAGVFVSAWAVAGAHGVAVDGLGNVYVSGTSAIGKYTSAGALVTSWGTAGSGNGQFNTPLGVAADAAGNVYVADTNNGRIQRFTASGAYVSQWGALTTPDGVAEDVAGHVLVAETGAHRIDAFSLAGALISQWGTQGAGNAQFQAPRAVTSGAGNDVLVLDTGNSRLEIFGAVTSTGLVSSANPSVFGQPVTLTATVSPGTVAAPVTFKDGAAVMGSAGTAGGVATFGVNLAVGSHSLTALYIGDGNSAASTSPAVAQQVNVAATTTTLATTLSPSGMTQAVTFTASVHPVPPATGTPTGNASFVVSGVPTNIALVAGVASLTSSTLPAGASVISASYGGDASFSASSASPLTQTVVPAESPQPYVLSFGTAGTDPGQVLGAFGIAVNAAGMVYVIERNGNRVQEFDPHGSSVAIWGTAGAGNGQFNTAFGIAIDAAGNIYVADSGNNRIQRFTGEGVYLGQWGTAGAGNGQFNSPDGIAVDATGNVFVCEVGNNRVQKFTSTGGYLTQWGTLGTGNGQFSAPYVIAAAPNGNVYVGEITGHRIQEFTGAGAYVTQWGGSGSGPGVTGYPRGLAIDAAGNVFEADQYCGCIQKFTSGGALLAQSTIPAAFNGFFNPGGPALDRSGNLYGAEPGNDRIDKFGHAQRITAVIDVKADQGHQVRIRITGSGADTTGSGTVITGYELYRQVTAANAAQQRAHRSVPSPTAVTREGWDFLATLPAHGDTSYSAVVPTLADSNASGIHWANFLALATTSAPTVTFSSAPDSGYSVDNLPPAPPAPFTAAYRNGGTALHWGQSGEPDLWYYRLYRGATGFTPSPANLIATRSDTGYVDPGAAGNSYALSAVDVDGNESGYALLTAAGTLAVGSGGPLTFVLEGPHPNPAHGAALTIAFTLASPASARLELLDVGGRLVAGREVAALGLGRHVIELAAGHALAPGVYLVRLTQGASVRTARAVIVE